MNLVFGGYVVAASVVWLALAGVPSGAEVVMAILVVWSGWWLFDRILDRPAPVSLRFGPRLIIGLIRYLGGSVLPDMLQSTWQVFRIVLRDQPAIRPAIVAVTIPQASLPMLTLLAYGIALTPGQQVVAFDEARHTLYIHAIHAPDPDALRTQVLTTYRDYLEALRW